MRQLALDGDASARSRAARQAAARIAVDRGIDVVGPDEAPATRSAVLNLSGWSGAAEQLAAVTRLPLRQQPIRSDGVWLAPWLLSRGVVDSTAGAMLPLSFDIRDAAPQDYAQVLGEVPPGPGADRRRVRRLARREGRRSPGTTRLFAASRAAYMPASAGHAGHETQVSWFPGGTITPVGPITSSSPTGP